MNIPIHNITTMLMSMAAATYLLCAMVLWLGGWLNHERRYHSSKLQKYLGVIDMISCVIIMLMVQLDGMKDGVSEHWRIVADWLCYIPYAMLYPASVLLCQQRPDWKCWAYTFGPMAMGLAAILMWSDAYIFVAMLTYGVLLVYLLLLYTYSLYKLRRWDRKMCVEFSDISHKQTVWFRRLTVPFMLLPLAWIPMCFYPEQEWIAIAFYLTSASLAVAMSSHALVHEEFDFDASVLLCECGDNECNAYDDALTDTEHASNEQPAWVEKLNKAMQEQHLYRQSDLTLSHLAEEIGINRTYLSQYFSRSDAGSFYNYIATFRIEEAKSLLRETDRSLSEIASLCGFTSQASFSRTFRNNLGITPTEYRKG